MQKTLVKAKTTDNPSLDLDWGSLIKLERETITRKRFVINSISFYLNQEIINTIKQAKDNHISVNLPSDFLLDLRYYTIFEPKAYLQSGLTFCTYYQDSDSSEIILRSLISLDGDIINQIRSDCLENQEFALQVAAVHYWLISQITRQLKHNLSYDWLNWFSWSLAIIIVAITVIFSWQKFQLQPLLLLLIPVVCWLLYWGFKRLLRLCLPSIRRWFLGQILGGIFSHPEPKRQLFFKFFSRFLA